ncbi:MAG: hypothetical protein IMZ55_13775 [Acidobacteria bacterium]|nr:hypothetical protein [Acidobacteriota bacterium]
MEAKAFTDGGPFNVYEGKRLIASRARVIYEDGKLYVVRSSTAVKSFDVPEPVAAGAETWTAGPLKFTRRGCSTCGWQLKGLSRAQLILNAVPSEVAA